MKLKEWLDSLNPARSTGELLEIRTVDGIPNVAVVRGWSAKTIPNGFNNWIWLIPLEEDRETLTGDDNPYVFVEGQSWFDYVEERNESTS